MAVWAIKYVTELINIQKEYHSKYSSMDPFQENPEIIIPEPPKILKISLEENSIKISLLRSLNILLKSQLSPPIPKISNRDLYNLHKKNSKKKENQIEHLQVIFFE